VIWTVLALIGLGLAAAFAALLLRRQEQQSLAEGIAERRTARERGSDRARLQYPHVDLTRCIGCGTCVKACPEDGVLEVLHGQAVVVHGARCVGHGRCAEACPTGALSITLGDLSGRRDIPAIEESLEAIGTPGLFLAGEVTGHALVRTALSQGLAVANEVARKLKHAPPVPQRRARVVVGSGGSELEAAGEDPLLDLVVVGAGPAGIACALGAKDKRVDCVVFEQEVLGGTVAKYPRRKLVMTQPIELPLVGKLTRDSYSKEELVELWERIVREQELDVRYGAALTGVERQADGTFLVTTTAGTQRARYVCLALGRRGTPRKLGVPGEELPKVSYSLLDAESYTDQRLLVVGGGDSAIEAALGLAEQPGNHVTVSYRKSAFSRLKARNEARIEEALRERTLEVLFDSEVERIDEGQVILRLHDGQGGTEEVALPNDEVFVFAGGQPPYALLEKNGVSFDPSVRKTSEPLAERGSGLLVGLGVALALTVLVLAWTFALRGYYALPLHERVAHPQHDWLRPSAGIGLAFGVVGASLILTNLAYLLRRRENAVLRFGSLYAWMTSHVATGILALVFALAHSALAPGHTVGGHALALLGVLVATGAIGRYFYAYVPRAANGRELELDEIEAALAGLSGEWDQGQRGFGERARLEVQQLVERGRWRTSFLARLAALWRSQGDLRKCLARLETDARAEGLPERQIHDLVALARRAHRAGLMASHFEDLRALLTSWRYLHRWVALLMVLLLVWHVVSALRYANIAD
jgi:thioredoxin reductase/ferredoxin